MDNMVNRVQKLEDGHKWMETAINDLRDAFPGKDTEGHLRYHELMIKRVERTERLISAIQEKTISGLIWGGYCCGWLIVLAGLP